LITEEDDEVGEIDEDDEMEAENQKQSEIYLRNLYSQFFSNEYK
jgi:hypothetical protein